MGRQTRIQQHFVPKSQMTVPHAPFSPARSSRSDLAAAAAPSSPLEPSQMTLAFRTVPNPASSASRPGRPRESRSRNIARNHHADVMNDVDSDDEDAMDRFTLTQVKSSPLKGKGKTPRRGKRVNSSTEDDETEPGAAGGGYSDSDSDSQQAPRASRREITGRRKRVREDSNVASTDSVASHVSDEEGDGAAGPSRTGRKGKPVKIGEVIEIDETDVEYQELTPAAPSKNTKRTTRKRPKPPSSPEREPLGMLHPSRSEIELDENSTKDETELAKAINAPRRSNRRIASIVNHKANVRPVTSTSSSKNAPAVARGKSASDSNARPRRLLSVELLPMSATDRARYSASPMTAQSRSARGGAVAQASRSGIQDGAEAAEGSEGSEGDAPIEITAGPSSERGIRRSNGHRFARPSRTPTPQRPINADEVEDRSPTPAVSGEKRKNRSAENVSTRKTSASIAKDTRKAEISQSSDTAAQAAGRIRSKDTAAVSPPRHTSKRRLKRVSESEEDRGLSGSSADNCQAKTNQRKAPMGKAVQKSKRKDRPVDPDAQSSSNLDSDQPNRRTKRSKAKMAKVVYIGSKKDQSRPADPNKKKRKRHDPDSSGGSSPSEDEDMVADIRMDEADRFKTTTRLRRKKETAVQRILRKQRAKRQGIIETTTEESDSEEDESDIDTESSGNLHARRPRVRGNGHGRTGPIEIDDSDDFIEDDGDVDPSDLLPHEFSLNSTQSPEYKYKVVFHYLLLLVMGGPRILPLKGDLKDYLLPNLKDLRKRMGGLRDGSVRSQIWKVDFVRALEKYPVFETTELDFAEQGCDACNISTRMSSKRVQMGGEPYDKETHEPIEDSSSESDSDSELSDDSGASRAKGPPNYLMGRHCHRRAMVFHHLCHWEDDLYSRIKGFYHDLLRALNRPVPDDSEASSSDSDSDDGSVLDSDDGSDIAIDVDKNDKQNEKIREKRAKRDRRRKLLARRSRRAERVSRLKKGDLIKRGKERDVDEVMAWMDRKGYPKTTFLIMEDLENIARNLEHDKSRDE